MLKKAFVSPVRYDCGHLSTDKEYYEDIKTGQRLCFECGKKAYLSQKGIEKWLDYTFESSAGLTPEFAQFNKEIKDLIKKSLPDCLELVSWNKGHFEFSGFLRNKNTGKFVYFSCSDVRYFKNAWYEDLLVRTAENEKDFTGGSNNFCKLSELAEKSIMLTSKK